MDGSYSNYVPSSVTIIEVMNHWINESLAKKCFIMYFCVAMSSFAQNILFMHSLSLYDVDAIKIVHLSQVLYLCMCPINHSILVILIEPDPQYYPHHLQIVSLVYYKNINILYNFNLSFFISYILHHEITDFFANFGTLKSPCHKLVFCWEKKGTHHRFSESLKGYPTSKISLNSIIKHFFPTFWKA